MKRRLLDHLRCLECASPLRAENPVFHAVRKEEIMGGALRCTRCARAYPVRAGVPSFLEGLRPHSRTGSSFGYLWSRSAERPGMPARYHLDRMRESLRLPPLRGLVLDAGCGEGIDLVNAARGSGAEGLIGVELSDGGSRVSFQRTFWHPSVHVIQADLRRLPFAPETFDFIYSYGVLHHLPDPAAGCGAGCWRRPTDSAGSRRSCRTRFSTPSALPAPRWSSFSSPFRTGSSGSLRPPARWPRGSRSAKPRAPSRSRETCTTASARRSRRDTAARAPWRSCAKRDWRVSTQSEAAAGWWWGQNPIPIRYRVQICTRYLKKRG